MQKCLEFFKRGGHMSGVARAANGVVPNGVVPEVQVQVPQVPQPAPEVQPQPQPQRERVVHYVPPGRERAYAAWCREQGLPSPFREVPDCLMCVTRNFRRIERGACIGLAILNGVGALGTLALGRVAQAFGYGVSSLGFWRGDANVRQIIEHNGFQIVREQLEVRVNALQREVQQLQGEREQLQAANQQFATQLQELRNLLQNGDQMLRDRYRDFTDLSVRAAATQARLEAAVEQHADERERLQHVRGELQQVTAELQNAQQSLTQILAEQADRLKNTGEQVAQRIQQSFDRVASNSSAQPGGFSNAAPTNHQTGQLPRQGSARESAQPRNIGARPGVDPQRPSNQSSRR